MPVTNYIWDEVNDTLLMEKDETGNTTAAYTYEPGQYGPLISQRRNGQTRYHHFDGQGSTRALSDANQIVTDSSTYSAFGETMASSGTTTNPFGYKGALGYYANAETNDFYVRTRTYSPAICRWLTTDPVISGDHPNPYLYRHALHEAPALATGWRWAWPTDAEPSPDPSGQGGTRCDVKGENKGKPIVRNDNRACTRPCTEAHEQFHVTQLENLNHPLGKCCAAARQAFANATTAVEKNNVIGKWNVFTEDPAVASLVEYPAYLVSVNCAIKMHNGLRCRECPKWPKPVNASSEKVIGVTSALALVSPVGIWLTWRKCCDEIIAYYLKSKEEFDSLKEKIKGKAYPPCPF